MEKLVTTLAKHFAGVLLISQIIACSPARYTYLKKIRISEDKNVATDKRVPNTDVACLNCVTVVNERAEAVIQPVVLADKSRESAGTARVRHTLKKVQKRLTSIADTRNVTEKQQRKAYTEPPEVKINGSQPTEETSDARHGLIWSLVSAAVIVWLIGVLFTSVGGFINVLLGVALVLVILDLLG